MPRRAELSNLKAPFSALSLVILDIQKGPGWPLSRTGGWAGSDPDLSPRHVVTGGHLHRCGLVALADVTSSGGGGRCEQHCEEPSLRPEHLRGGTFHHAWPASLRAWTVPLLPGCGTCSMLETGTSFPAPLWRASWESAQSFPSGRGRTNCPQ